MTNNPTQVEPQKCITHRWQIDRPEGAKADRLKVPQWVVQRRLLIGSYLELGWTAFDQNDKGRIVATGEWGHELAQMADGTIICTEYPHGRPCLMPAPTGEANDGRK